MSSFKTIVPSFEEQIADNSTAGYKAIEWSSGKEQIVGIGLNSHDEYAIEQILRGALAASAPEHAAKFFTVPPNPSGGMTFRDHFTVSPVLNHFNGSIKIVDVGSRRLTVGSMATTGITKPVTVEQTLERVRIIETPSGPKISNIQLLSSIPLSPLPLDKSEPVEEKFVGLNYYPASANWQSFWIEYPEEEIEQDLDRMAGMNANSVRIFLHVSSFRQGPLMNRSLQRLEHFLGAAHARGLSVIITCFDMGADYNLLNIDSAYMSLSSILEVASRTDGSVLIDLKNEADRDDHKFGAAQVDAWLTVLLALSRHEYPNAKFTIGWSEAAQAERLIDLVDIVSFHDFGNPHTFSERIASVTKAAGGKPVIVTEIGHSRAPFGWLGEQQVHKLKLQFRQAHGLDGILIWTLNDFAQVPASVAGRNPWRRLRQSQFGLNRESSEAFTTFAEEFRRSRLAISHTAPNQTASERGTPQ